MPRPPKPVRCAQRSAKTRSATAAASGEELASAGDFEIKFLGAQHFLHLELDGFAHGSRANFRGTDLNIQLSLVDFFQLTYARVVRAPSDETTFVGILAALDQHQDPIPSQGACTARWLPKRDPGVQPSASAKGTRGLGRKHQRGACSRRCNERCSWEASEAKAPCVCLPSSAPTCFRLTQR